MKDLQELVTKLQSTSSINEKKAFLAQYPQCKRILWWVNNPYKQFFVSSKNILKNPSLSISNSHQTIFDLLKALSEREITGHNAIAACNTFLRDNYQHKDLILNIIDKDLKIRAGASIINQVWPNYIPTFKVALANKYEDFSHKMAFKDGWLVSRKLDGVRIITIIDKKGHISFYSRTGKPIHTLNNVRKALQRLKLKEKVLDGEVCIMVGTRENFASMISQIRRKNYTIHTPIYKVFDYLTLKEFQEGKSKRPFSERYNSLIHLQPVNYVRKVNQFGTKSDKRLQEWLKCAIENGWEGLILRKDAPYKGKRSNDMLKVKKFHDAEYKVLDIEIGPFRIVKYGKEKTITTMTNVIIKHKGNKVSVGSGFTLWERQHFKKNPEDIIGKEITVQYFEESTNKNGGISLRFPTKKAIYNKRDI